MPITLNLKQLNPMTTFTVTIDQNATIRNLKESIREINSVPVEAQRIIFAGQILKDENTIDSYGIKDGFTLHFVKSKQKNATTTSAPSSTTTSPSPSPSTAAGTSTGTGLHSTSLPPRNNGNSATFNTQPSTASSARSGVSRIPGFGNVDPSVLESMLNDPLTQSLVNTPEFGNMLKEMIRSNPQYSQMLEQHPEISSALDNPEVIRQLQDALSSPEAFRDFTRHIDTMMNRFENTPGLFTELEHANETIMDAFRKRATTSEPPPPPNTAADPNKNTEDVFGTEEQHPQRNSDSMNPFMGLPDLSSMGSNPNDFGGMNGALNQQMLNLLSNPEIQRQCQEMLKNPQMIELLCQSHPEMRSFLPLLQNPEFMRNMFNPQMMQMLNAISQSYGGMNGNPSQERNFPFAAPTASTSFPSRELTQEQIEEAKIKFAPQLEKLREMGFDDEKKCITTLIATNGSLNITIEKLMG